jgi:hypothetical protein
MSLKRARYAGTIHRRASGFAFVFATACHPAVVNTTPIIDDANESELENVQCRLERLRDGARSPKRASSVAKVGLSGVLNSIAPNQRETLRPSDLKARFAARLPGNRGDLFFEFSPSLSSLCRADRVVIHGTKINKVVAAHGARLAHPTK